MPEAAIAYPAEHVSQRGRDVWRPHQLEVAAETRGRDRAALMTNGLARTSSVEGSVSEVVRTRVPHCETARFG